MGHVTLFSEVPDNVFEFGKGIDFKKKICGGNVIDETDYSESQKFERVL